MPTLSHDPLRCQYNGICVTTTGTGKSKAGPSLTAILHAKQLNMSNSYFVISGIAGTRPDAGTDGFRGSLGFGGIANWIVDGDLGSHFHYRDVSPSDPFEVRRWAWVRVQDYENGQFHLNEQLAALPARFVQGFSGNRARASWMRRRPGQGAAFASCTALAERRQASAPWTSRFLAACTARSPRPVYPQVPALQIARPPACELPDAAPGATRGAPPSRGSQCLDRHREAVAVLRVVLNRPFLLRLRELRKAGIASVQVEVLLVLPMPAF